MFSEDVRRLAQSDGSWADSSGQPSTIAVGPVSLIVVVPPGLRLPCRTEMRKRPA